MPCATLPESIQSWNHWNKLVYGGLNLYQELSGNPDQRVPSTKCHDSDFDVDSDEDGKPKAKPEPVKELPRKKQSWPFLLLYELNQVQEYVKDFVNKVYHLIQL